MDVPGDLVDQIARGKGVVFVGAGLSQGAGLPGWPTLLRQMLVWSEKHGKELADRAELEGYIDNGELLLVAEEMRERLGRDDFRRFMVEIFRKSGLKPTATQMLLPQIPFAAALTSNYETLLESAYTLARGAMPHVFTHEDYPELSAALRTGEFYVLTVFPHRSLPVEVVLCSSEGPLQAVPHQRRWSCLHNPHTGAQS